MPDDETIVLRDTVIGGHRHGDDFTVLLVDQFDDFRWCLFHGDITNAIAHH